jgi:hypothetical protein
MHARSETLDSLREIIGVYATMTEQEIEEFLQQGFALADARMKPKK